MKPIEFLTAAVLCAALNLSDPSMLLKVAAYVLGALGMYASFRQFQKAQQLGRS